MLQKPLTVVQSQQQQETGKLVCRSIHPSAPQLHDKIDLAYLAADADDADDVILQQTTQKSSINEPSIIAKWTCDRPNDEGSWRQQQ